MMMYRFSGKSLFLSMKCKKVDVGNHWLMDILAFLIPNEYFSQKQNYLFKKKGKFYFQLFV